MIYDVIERAATIVLANFTTDLETLITAKKLQGLDSSITIYKRQMAELFADQAVPGLGIYVTTVATQAKNQGKRDSDLTTVFDYYARHTDAEKLSQQVELAVEALLRSMDRLFDSVGVLDAGAQEGSTLVLLTPVGEPAGMKFYERRATVSFPVRERDEGL